MRRTEVRSRLSPELWDAFIESPLANIVRLAVSDDTLRGALIAEALTADHTYADDPSLAQNRAFVADAIAQARRLGVPAGGGIELARSLTHSAVSAGARIVTGGTVQRIQPMGEAPVRVTYRAAGETREVTAQRVLATVPPWTLDELLGDSHEVERPEGATAIATLLVSRLPQLAGDTPAELALSGAFIANASAELLDDARRQYSEGFIPVTLPCLVRVPTLADPRLLPHELRTSGAHILHVTALGLPYSLGERMPPDLFRERVQSGILRSLSAVFGEDIEGLLLTDALGQPCVRTWTSVDIEDEFGYPGGHISQDSVEWPFVEEHDGLSSPGERWGVSTSHVRVFRAGGSVRRAGASAGLGGFAAAMAVFEADS
jgi:phytoene dehydrogenase-like protein